MKRFVEGTARDQTVLFPPSLDEYVSENNAVRVVDAFVDKLNLTALGFVGIQPAATGRPAYHPSVMLKLHIYGYLNRIQSSRRIERETHRNVEVMWLTGQLTPDHKTISDFRKDNGPAITRVCAEFVQVCRQLDLLVNAEVAIDGSKFKALNNRDRNFTPAKMKQRQEKLEKHITKYLAELDKADQEETPLPAVEVERLQARLETLDQEMQRLKALEEEMNATPDKQLSLTDPDARSMKTRGGGIVGYNVQTAVDTTHHLIVAHEVTNTGSDRHQLAPMAEQAKAALDTETLTAVADRGYYESHQLLACQETNITTYVPKPDTSNNKAKGLYGREDFRYHVDNNTYECPAGERLIHRHSRQEQGRLVHRYWSSACGECQLKVRCTPSKERRISRWEHEEVLEAVQQRLAGEPEKMRLRRQTAEHPFGTLKAWMGATHFQTKTLPRVKTEMSLQVLAYNLKRVMNLIGVDNLLKAVQA